LKISSAIVGREVGPDTQHIDKRWVMAYNAALGEVSDTPHPLFPVSYEWPAMHELRVATGLQEINARLVHAQHDLVVHRKVRFGESLTIKGKVVAATQRSPGAFVVFRLTAEAAGEPVTTTHYGMLYRGVTLEGAASGSVEDPPKLETQLKQAGDVVVSATAGHVYTECARIWNPIHTDPEYARAAGLPGIILHGTATLALSVSQLTKAAKRVRCRFAGMVLMPSTLTVHASLHLSTTGDEILFETRNADGDTVIERGRIS
jgi:acyl dehydratase